MTKEERIKLCEEKIILMIHDYIEKYNDDLNQLAWELAKIGSHGAWNEARKLDLPMSYPESVLMRLHEEFDDILNDRICTPEKAKGEGS